MPDTRKDLLTETALKAAKPRTKSYKLRDGGGLHLLITPTGGKWWRFRYRHTATSETMLSFGEYPTVSLKAARDRRDAARKQIRAGVDPGAARRTERSAQGHTFSAIADEWLALRLKDVAKGHLTEASVERDRRQLGRWVNPEIGTRPITVITTQHLLKALKKIEAAGKHHTTHRTRKTCERVFSYAKRLGLITSNPADADNFDGVLASRATTHYAAILEPKKVGALLRAIDGYDGQPVTHAALRILPYVFTRPGELRTAEWIEVDIPAAEWRIPAGKMKMRDPHIVPLARQAVAILKELKKLTGLGKYVFPAIGSGERPLSDGTINSALRRLGYSSDEMTPHGFRSMASTLLNEQGTHPDLIELQLAHKADNVRAIYNRSIRLDERRKMMQKWADYLDTLRAGKS